MEYTAAFPQSGSSSAGNRVISASDIGQTINTWEGGPDQEMKGPQTPAYNCHCLPYFPLTHRS